MYLKYIGSLPQSSYSSVRCVGIERRSDDSARRTDCNRGRHYQLLNSQRWTLLPLPYLLLPQCRLYSIFISFSGYTLAVTLEIADATLGGLAFGVGMTTYSHKVRHYLFSRFEHFIRLNSFQIKFTYLKLIRKEATRNWFKINSNRYLNLID